MQYQKKPDVIDAVQWDGTQEGFINDIQPFGPVSSSYSSGPATVYVPIGKGVYMQKNDWLCRDYFGIFSVVKSEDFDNLYQAV